MKRRRYIESKRRAIHFLNILLLIFKLQASEVLSASFTNNVNDSRRISRARGRGQILPYQYHYRYQYSFHGDDTLCHRKINYSSSSMHSMAMMQEDQGTKIPSSKDLQKMTLEEAERRFWEFHGESWRNDNGEDEGVRGATSLSSSLFFLNQLLQKFSKERKPERSLEVLDRASSFLQPDLYSYSIVIHAFARNGDDEMAQYVFDQLKARNKLRPNVYVYNALLSAYANSNNVEKCLALLNLMERGDDPMIVPTVVTYSTVINCLCKVDRITEALSILDKMVSRGVQPNVVTYNSILAAWSRRAKVDFMAAREAEVLLENMEKFSIDYSPPDLVSYCTVVHALCNANEARRAERVLKKIEDKGLRINSSHTYNAVLHAWARDQSPSAPIRVSRLLLQMINQHNKCNSVKPDHYSYQALIDAYAKCEESGSAQKAEAVLLQMLDGASLVKPNVYHYNSVLSAWARSKDSNGPLKAEAIVAIMEENLISGNGVRPNAISYSCIIDAWSKSGQNGSSKRALQVLKRMKTLEKQGYTECAPTIVTLNLVLSALVSDRTESAENIEKFMTYVVRLYCKGKHNWLQSDVAYTFSIMINAYSKLSSQQAIEKCEQVLERMQSLGIKPTPEVYNSIINVYAEAGASNGGELAEDLLRTMIKAEVNPDICTYNSILKCWVKSSDNDKAYRSYKLLSEARKVNRAFDRKDLLIAYNSLLNSCANSTKSGAYDAFQIALDAYKDVQNSCSVSADHITYATFLKVCGIFIDDDNERSVIVRKVFKRCCEDGQVSNIVLRALHASSREDEYCRLLEGAFKKGCVSMNEIPLEWTCNVPVSNNKTRFLSSAAKSLSHSQHNMFK